MCDPLGILTELFEWLHKKDVSQPVKGSKSRRANAEPLGDFRRKP